jgi:hypothetical protein
MPVLVDTVSDKSEVQEVAVDSAGNWAVGNVNAIKEAEVVAA